MLCYSTCWPGMSGKPRLGGVGASLHWYRVGSVPQTVSIHTIPLTGLDLHYPSPMLTKPQWVHCTVSCGPQT